jgi:hypothetical protein
LSISSACALSAENATQFSPSVFEAGCDAQAVRNRIKTRKIFLLLSMGILLSMETLEWVVPVLCETGFCLCYPFVRFKNPLP